MDIGKKFITSFNQIDKRRVGAFADLWKIPAAVADSLKMYCGEEGYRPDDTCKPISALRDPRRFFMDELPNGQQEQVYHSLIKTRKRSYKTLWLAEAGALPGGC